MRLTKFDGVDKVTKNASAKKAVFPQEEYERLISQNQTTAQIAASNKPRIAPFAIVSLILMLLLQSVSYLSAARNAKGEILGAATSAYSDLSSASSNFANQNFADAQNLFNEASSNLQDAQDKLDQFKALQIIATQAKSADHVLTAASLLASAGGRLASALDLFGQLKVDSSGVSNIDVTSLLKQNKDSIESTLFLLKEAQGEFNQVTDLPQSYSETLTKAKEQVNALTGLLQNLTNLEDVYLGLFGQGPRTYLLIFQNYDEVRATGGFIGTYGVVKIDGGKIQSLKIDSIYDLDGQIYQKIAAPGPFQPEIEKWGIRDANWFADFPLSAQKLLNFYEFGAETADGVIAVTPQLFENILTLTGPVQMPGYKVTLTAENFQETVQYETSVNYDKKLNQPKKFLADFAPILLDRLTSLDKENWLKLLGMFETNLTQKQILLYVKDSQLEQKIQSLKFAGEILPTDGDYLDIVNTNLGGTKTDLKVNQTANLEAKVDSDGVITDTLTITRTNNASELNKDFLRVLVPLNSTLVAASGFDVGNFEPSISAGFKTDPDLNNWDQGREVQMNVYQRVESGKTEFTGWSITNPGETKTITLVYTIPAKINIGLFKASDSYSLLFQKQDGVKPYGLTASLNIGELKPNWLSSDANFESGKIKFDYTTGSDQYWAVLLTK